MLEADASNYRECEMLAATRKRKLDNNTYLIVYDDHYAIKLHNTEIVEHWPEHTLLRTGGWKTVTTKDRINKFSPVSISQEAGVWYVHYRGAVVAFGENMTINRVTSVITGAGPDPKEQKKLRKQANQFAKDYVDALFAGKVPAPSGGDCWSCLIRDQDGNNPLGGPDHMKSHIKENYFVPSILTQKGVADRLSMMAKNVIAGLWQGHGADMSPPNPASYAGVLKDQIRRAVRWFVLHELGLAT